MARILVGIVALALIALAIWRLEAERAGLQITRLAVGEIPVTTYLAPDADGPGVVIAHGFAGSQQLMEAYALTLAKAGYRVFSFDFAGHGRNRQPMSSDVTEIEGTTRQLVGQVRALVAHAGGPSVALLGHSMASDVIVRAAAEEPLAGPVVAISAFSQAIDASTPQRLLLVTGAGEPGLREAALRYLRQVAPEAQEGETAEQGGVLRRAVVAPMVEHVGVLYSATGLREACAWLDAAYGRAGCGGSVAATGGWIALLLAGSVVLAWPLARSMPADLSAPAPVGVWRALVPVVVAGAVTPLVLSLFETRVLPVVVADYLALHLLLYGLLALGVARAMGLRPVIGPLWPGLLLIAFGLGVFGLALDRYAASFVPHAGRLPIIAAVALGAIPAMLADAVLTEAGRAPWLQRIAVRAGFLASLGLAVALDFERLFFLVIILPVIVLFFVVFGQMSGWLGRRTGAAGAAGLGLGVILAWAIGVSFPLLAA